MSWASVIAPALVSFLSYWVGYRAGRVDVDREVGDIIKTLEAELRKLQGKP